MNLKNENRIIVTTAFGDRKKQLQKLVEHLKIWTNLKLLVITDNQQINHIEGCSCCSYRTVKTMWHGHKRYGHRNSNYWRMAILSDLSENILYMDNDIRILRNEFYNGFELSKLFGMCMALSPRVFVHFDAKKGVDKSEQIKYLKLPYAPVCNPGMFFANCSDERVKTFSRAFTDIYMKKAGRGPLGVWLAAEKCHYHPLILPHQYLVCSVNAEYCKNYPYENVKAVMLHKSGPQIYKTFFGK